MKRTALFSIWITLTVVVSTLSTISCSVSPTSIIIGSSTKISGPILPAVANANVTISYRFTGGTWSTLSTVYTTSEGNYSYTWTPTATGTYEVKASWGGDESHSEVESGAVTIEVTKETSEITCAISSEEIRNDEAVMVTGSLSPIVANAIITLTFTLPDGHTTKRWTATTWDGKFSLNLWPWRSGTWSVSASWAGDNEHEGATSASVSFIVEGESQSFPIDYLTDYLTRPDVFGAILATISLLGGGTAWFIRRRKRARARTVLDEVDKVYSRFKMNSRRCEAELYRLKDMTLEKLKKGEIDESSYNIIKERIGEYLHEIRERIVDERLGGFPSKLRDELHDMIKKGEISEKEYKTLGTLIERTVELKEREKAQLRELLEKWKKDYLKKH